MTGNEKRAFWRAFETGVKPGINKHAGPVSTVLKGGAKMLAGGAANYATGTFGLPQVGKGIVNTAVHTGAQLAPVVEGIGGSIVGRMGPSVTNPLTGNPLFGGKTVTGSHVFDRFAKHAFHMSPADLVDAAAYAAFAGSKFVDPHEHPVLHTALDAGALAALAGTTGYGMLAGKDEYKPGVKDLIGLGLMGSALYDRAKSH